MRAILAKSLAAAVPEATSQAGATATSPVITAISSHSGPPVGGTTVIIAGCGFTGATSVTGTAPATFTQVSDTQIIATSPHAPTVPVAAGGAKADV